MLFRQALFFLRILYIDEYYSNASTNFRTQQNQQVGEFHFGDLIIAKNDVLNDWPMLWRVNGKTLLQRYEPLHTNAKTIYRSISTVSVFVQPSSTADNIDLFFVNEFCLLLRLVCYMESRQFRFIFFGQM